MALRKALSILRDLRFTYSVMALICVNMILLGLQVDAGSFPPYQEPGWYDTVNSIIVVIFVCEPLFFFFQSFNL